jgi:hypothetical protein
VLIKLWGSLASNSLSLNHKQWFSGRDSNLFVCYAIRAEPSGQWRHARRRRQSGSVKFTNRKTARFRICGALPTPPIRLHDVTLIHKLPWAAFSTFRHQHLHKSRTSDIFVIKCELLTGARGGVVGWGTMLQTGRWRDRFPIRSLDFSIDLILPAKWVPEILRPCHSSGG